MLKDDQFTGLLDALPAADRKDLWLCVAVLGYTGVRPSELATLQVVNVEASVAGTKRNSKTMSQPAKRRLIMPLEIEGRNREGKRALDLFVSGLVKLPKAVRNQISRLIDPKHPNPTDSFQAVGKEAAQQLKRCEHWQNLSAAQPELSVYSVRHAVAFRSAFGANRLPIRVMQAARAEHRNACSALRHVDRHRNHSRRAATVQRGGEVVTMPSEAVLAEIYRLKEQF